MPHVTSADGTTIAYDKRGEGPPLVIVDGALCSRRFGPSEAQAARLAERFTVYIYDRRGRGESGDRPPYAVEREIADEPDPAARCTAPFDLGAHWAQLEHARGDREQKRSSQPPSQASALFDLIVVPRAQVDPEHRQRIAALTSNARFCRHKAAVAASRTQRRRALRRLGAPWHIYEPSRPRGTCRATIVPCGAIALVSHPLSTSA